MIHLVLNDLRSPAGVGLDAGLQFQVLVLDFDGFIAFARTRSAEKGDDTLLDPDHIRRHADTAFLVRHQRIKQVMCDLQIFFCCDFRLPCKEDGVVHQFFYHFLTYILLNY